MINGKSDIRSLVKKTKKRFDPITFFTSTKFKHIFGFWFFVIIIFGIAFYLLGFTQNQGLIQGSLPLSTDINGFFNALYFSVISATATGYGDLVPHGWSKLLATLEVILGLTIFGMLISKLVSYKQEIILEEVYEISFDEKINRLRSSLYLFRADTVRTMDYLEDSSLSRRRVQEITLLLNSLHNTLNDIERLLCPKTKKDFIKKIDELKLELVLNSIDLSLSKIVELINLMNSKEYSWRDETILHIINKIQGDCKQIYGYYKDKNLSSKTLLKIKEINKHVQDLDKSVEGLHEL